MQLDFHRSSPEERAWSAYFRYPGEAVLDQPSKSLSGTCDHRGRSYVVLRNGYRTLAVFRVRNDLSLRRMKRWPKVLD